MAAPATTTRATPSGRYLPDGFSTKIAFSRDSDFSIWETSVPAPGLDGGDAIDTTSMHNTTFRTMRSRKLYTLSELSVTGFFDPNFYNDAINNLLNQEGSVTISFPDGSTLDFFGYLRSMEVNDLVEGEVPSCTITIQPTNFDVANNVEANPVLTEVAGT